MSSTPVAMRPVKVCMVGAPSAGKSCLVSRFKEGEFKEDDVTVGVAFVSHTIAIAKSTLPKSLCHSSYMSRFFTSPDHKPLYPAVEQPIQEMQVHGNGTSTTNVPDPTDPTVLHVPLNIWDTAGSERYAILTKKYYQGSEACLVCYDLTDQETWVKLQTWVQQVQDSEPDVLLVLIGTKKDLIASVSKEIQLQYNPGATGATTALPRAVPIDQVRNYALTIGAVVFETTAKYDGDLTNCDYIAEVFNFIAHETAHRRAVKPTRSANPNAVDLNQRQEAKKSDCC